MSAAVRGGRRRGRVPRFYFSLRSPYSWLAYRDLIDRYPRTAEAVEWVPFFEPDELSRKLLAEAGGAFPYTPMSAEKHRYILQDVRRLAAGRGLEFTWPVDREPVWEVPHLGYLAAARHGRGPEFVALAARARWELGLDICDRTVIAGFAGELGLGQEELACAADDSSLRAEGVRVLLEIQRDGVFGVPFFVDHYDKYWGVDRLPDFVAAIEERTAADPAGVPGVSGTPLPPSVSSVDDGHAGGCG
ncbi:2-hydroxychromene-2-carboxylate isomerase [Streptomyces umbrinus]|uniref:2-hydroxychromene-2-carboxylate isomerase n=1 Tax=Streptomyces umbrinus TaxID=67370 RepID=A0ABU0STU3_9ACTN|nr:2-hydroxychromene-2-carboxylate isomerase [Streptomyces umbrinus]MDQ1026950.1 2-hydroxychromene-2-carboxylate isomerase [Streptomyces umbrinus]